MSEMLHPDPANASAEGADVLAAIRRLLAQDQRPEDSAARNGALRHRLIGTRRQDTRAEAPAAGEDVPLWTAAPLRLADAQRVMPLTEVSMPQAPARIGAEMREDTPAEPRDAAPQAEVGTEVPAPDAWPFVTDHAVSRLRELLTFQAWIAEDDGAAPHSPTREAEASAASEPDRITAPAVPAQLETAPTAPLETVTDAPPTGAEAEPAPCCAEVAPVAVQQPEADPETSLQSGENPDTLPDFATGAPSLDLRGLIRETLLQELAGGSGAHLVAAIHDLTRRAVAGALADIARDMGALQTSDGVDLH